MKTKIGLLAIAIGLWTFSPAARAAEVECTSAQLAIANQAVATATSALDQAINKLGSPDSSVADLMQLWFGVASSQVADRIKSNFLASRVYLSGITFRCSNSTEINLGDVYAYVTPNQAFRIVLSAWFFGQDDNGFYSRPGIIIHEMTHFYLTAGTGDAEGSGDWILQKASSGRPKQGTTYRLQPRVLCRSAIFRTLEVLI
jgi:Lysine-specific metallo-endopeptidase